MLDLSSRKVYGALAEQCVGGDAKADKVENATSGHLAGLDSNGNLTDSGVSPTEEVTVEGNPVTFDSPFEQDAKSVVVSVKPIQDLHGYDHPWPAGGGKNKLPLVLADIKEANTNGTWSGNVYSIANGTIEILTDDGGNVTGIKANGTFNEQVLFYISGSVENQQSIIFNGVEDGSASTYSINMLINGTFAGDVYDGDSSIHTIPASSDYAYLIVLRSGYNASNLMFYPMVRDSSVVDATFAPYSNICPISGIDEVEIEVSDGESEPTTTTIPLPSTLYGGTVDVTEGSGTENDGFIEFDGSSDEVWYKESGYNLFTILVSELPAVSDWGYPIPNWLTNIGIIFAESSDSGAENHTISYGNSYLFIKSDIATVEDFKAWLANNPIQVLYPLTTSATLSFDPTDVELLEGTNVVSTNAEKVAVTYGRSLWQDINDLKTDTEGKLDKSDVADVEGDTASRPYAVNEFMLRSDGLYKVTQPIAQNASITASNTTKTTVGEVLTALLNA